MHRLSGERIAEHSVSSSSSGAGAFSNHCSRVIYTPDTSAAARSSPRRHVTTSPRVVTRTAGDGGGRHASKPVTSGQLSSLRVEMDRWKLQRDGAAEELFPFPFSIGCIKGKRQLRGGARCPFTEADL